MNRTRREDWLEQGFEVLREGGEAALTIDRLCRDLGRTKGAFYHHFADVTVYTDALLAAWEQRNTQLPAAATEPPAIRRGLRAVIEAAVRGFDVSLERSFRAWGLRDPRAHAFVARIDERRIAFLASRYAATLSAAMRRKLARLEYAVFIGMQQLYPELSVNVVRDFERILALALEGAAEQALHVDAEPLVKPAPRAAARRTAGGHRGGKARFLRG